MPHLDHQSERYNSILCTAINLCVAQQGMSDCWMNVYFVSYAHYGSPRSFVPSLYLEIISIFWSMLVAPIPILVTCNGGRILEKRADWK